MLATTLFFYGFLAACAGLLFQVLAMTFWASNSSFSGNLTSSLSFIIVAAIIEECMKLAFLGQAKKRYTISALFPLSLLTFGIGFALVEICMVALATDYTAWPKPLLPLFYNTLFHTSTVFVLGFSLKKFDLRHPLLWTSLAGVSLLHILYNLYRAFSA